MIYDTIYLLTAIGLSPGGSTHLVHLVGYFHGCITMHGFTNVKYVKRIFYIVEHISKRLKKS
jgi:hypothetical protein